MVAKKILNIHLKSLVMIVMAQVQRVAKLLNVESVKVKGKFFINRVL